MSKTSQLEKKIARALIVADEYGHIDGAHHKDWVIDQMVRALFTDEHNGYELWVARWQAAKGTTWDTGTAP